MTMRFNEETKVNFILPDHGNIISGDTHFCESELSCQVEAVSIQMHFLQGGVGLSYSA